MPSTLFNVDLKDTQDFTSRLISAQSFSKGDYICKIDGQIVKKAYTTVQISRDRHMEMDGDLTFMNHSCDPNVRIDTENFLVFAEKDIKEGDVLTFFYPSTEWDMIQPFQCWCGASSCIGKISGAKYLPASALEKYSFNKHIQELLDQEKENKN